MKLLLWMLGGIIGAMLGIAWFIGELTVKFISMLVGGLFIGAFTMALMRRIAIESFNRGLKLGQERV